MSTDDLRWLVGIAATLLGVFAGMLVGAFRALAGKIERGNGALAKGIKDGDDALHERINRVRDEYVRRVDLDERFRHFQELQREMRDDLKAIRDYQRNPPGNNS